MNIIKRGKIKRTEYLLIDRPQINGFHQVVKQGINGKVSLLFESSNLVAASSYFDNLFLKGQ